MWPLLLLPLLISGLLLSIAWGRLSCELDDAGMRLRGPLYGRVIPWNDLDVDTARVVDLTREPGLRATLRTNGIGLPGYRVGWFRLADGERALLFTTRADRLVAVQARGGFLVMVGVEDPESLVRALRDDAGGFE